MIYFSRYNIIKRGTPEVYISSRIQLLQFQSHKNTVYRHLNEIC